MGCHQGREHHSALAFNTSLLDTQSTSATHVGLEYSTRNIFIVTGVDWLCSCIAQVGDANSLTEDRDKQVERMGLTPDWIIQVTLTLTFACSASESEARTCSCLSSVHLIVFRRA